MADSCLIHCCCADKYELIYVVAVIRIIKMRIRKKEVEKREKEYRESRVVNV